jgi:hypothetical protein
MVAITTKCLLKEIACFPSMEDVSWNLQYVVQVEDTSIGVLEVDEHH